MQCRNCGYRLWNIQSRQCPECGHGFVPSDYDFVPGTVTFCCPHCQQAYYGTDAKGHLAPRSFTCATCQQPIDMDQMVLLPAAGVQEQQTLATDNPWSKRDMKSSTIRAWWRVCLRALFRPSDLVSPIDARTSYARSSWFFMFINLFVLVLLGISPFLILTIVMEFDHSGIWAVGSLLGMMALIVTVGFLPLLFAVGFWSGVTHGMLRLMGKPTCKFTETFDCICYASGTTSLAAIPIIGPVLFSWYTMLWWPISAGLILARQHQLSRIKSIIAVMVVPMMLFMSVVGYAAYEIHSYSSMQTSYYYPTSTLEIGRQILKQVNDDGTIGPDHILRFLFNPELQQTSWESELEDRDRDTWSGGLQEGFEDLRYVRSWNDDEKHKDRYQAYIKEVTKVLDNMLPIQGPGYRFGGMLFLNNKVTTEKLDPNLWLMVHWPRHDKTEQHAVFKADGTEVYMSKNELLTALDDQNALRRQLELPEIQSLDAIRIVPFLMLDEGDYEQPDLETLQVGKRVAEITKPDGTIGPDHIVRTFLDKKLVSEPFADMAPYSASRVRNPYPENWHGSWVENAAPSKKEDLYKQLDALPSRNGPGYRFGQMLLVYDGIPASKVTPELWLAIRWPKNDTLELTRVYKADGSIIQFFTEDMPKQLAAQEQLREQLGLPLIGVMEDFKEVTMTIPKVNECECEKE